MVIMTVGFFSGNIDREWDLSMPMQGRHRIECLSAHSFCLLPLLICDIMKTQWIDYVLGLSLYRNLYENMNVSGEQRTIL